MNCKPYRVQNPLQLALYLVKKNKDWSSSKIASILKTNDETSIAIKPSIPVYIAYFTTWVDLDGDLNFRNDIYNLDQELAKEFYLFYL